MQAAGDIGTTVPMHYREGLPSPQLAGMVDRTWFFRTGGSGALTTPVQQCVPHGTTVLILILRGEAHVLINGTPERLPAVHIVGVQRKPVLWTMNGRSLAMGVHLKPEAALRLFRMPLREVSPVYTAAEELLGAEWGRPLEPLFELHEEQRIMESMERFLLTRIREVSLGTERFITVFRQMRTEGLCFDHRGLGPRLHVSDRQAQRLFKEHLGLSPVHYHRIARFRHAYDRATEGLVSRWSDIAYDLGYADQAHFIRDFKAFCGITPGMLREGRASAFLLRGRTSTVSPCT